MVVAAHNLGTVMRNRFGSGKPRQFTAMVAIFVAFRAALSAPWRSLIAICANNSYQTDGSKKLTFNQVPAAAFRVHAIFPRPANALPPTK